MAIELCSQCDDNGCGVELIDVENSSPQAWKVECSVSNEGGNESTVSPRQAVIDWNATRPSGNRALTGDE